MNPTHRDQEPIGPWDAVALVILDEWDAGWAGACRAMSTNPWTGAVMSAR